MSSPEDLEAALRLPEDRPIFDLDALGASLSPGNPLHLTGARGSAGPLLVRRLVALGHSVLHIAPTLDTARRASSDFKAMALGLPVPGLSEPLPHAESLALFVPSAEPPPYAEIHPERGALLDRTANLFHLAERQGAFAAVVSATTLLRRVPPADRLLNAAVEIAEADVVDVTELSGRLVAAGYLRAPVVEDPGSFALRGGLLDVWPAGARVPVRVELDDEVVVGLKPFDPEDQRSAGTVPRLVIPPARESILEPEAAERARQAIRALCDAVNTPSTKARALAEEIASGSNYFGAEWFAPAFQPLVPLTDYLPEDTVVVLESAGECVEQLIRAWEGAVEAAGNLSGVAHFPPEALFLEPERLEAWLETKRVVLAHRTPIAGMEPGPLQRLAAAPEQAPTLATSSQDDLTRAIAGARKEGGKKGSLEPLERRIHAWRQAGLRPAISARAHTQAKRLGQLLSHRGLTVDSGVIGPDGEDGDDGGLGGSVKGAGLAPGTDADAVLVVSSLSRGLIAPALGWVLVTEEEIFGQRAHRRPRRTRTARAVLDDLRALQPGDFVVHVEHGVGRYLGLEKREVGPVAVELLVVEYHGGDKLFVPVYRLNQIQKHSGSEGNPKLDRLGGQTFSKTKAKVKKRVVQMADDLLRLYAERAAQSKEPLPALDDDYTAFEAAFPYEETRDQAAAISEVQRDLTSTRVMDRLVCGDVGFGKTEVALRATYRVAMAGRQVALLCPTTVLAQQHLLNFQTRLEGTPLVVRALSRFQSKAEQKATVQGLRDGKVDVVIATHRLLSKDIHFKRLGLLVVDEEQRFGVTHKERIKTLRATVDALTLTATPIPRTLQMAVGGVREMSLITTPPIDRRSIRTITSRFDEALIREAIERELDRGGQVFYVYNRVEGIHERAARVQGLVPRARVTVGHGQMTETALERTMVQFVDGQHDILVATAIIESGIDIPRANTIIIDRADLFGLAQLYQLRGRVGRSSERAYCYLLVPPPSQLSEEARSRIDALERHTELGSGFQIASLDMEIRGAGDLLGAEQSGFAASVGFDLFCQMLEEATHELRGETVTHEVDPEVTLDVDTLLPDSYISEVSVRLSLYKRLASATEESEVAEVGAEMEDRFGPPPPEAQRLVELMRLKTELRRLRALGCEARATSVTFHLRDDTPLDPAQVGKLLGSKGSPYRMSAEGRLTRRLGEGEQARSGLELADRALSELSGCIRADF